MIKPAIVAPKAKYIDDFKGLELLRFILSIAVIVWHYQHFFYPFVKDENRLNYFAKQPFFNELSFIYSYGLYAVHIFWFISGIIFLKIYETRISQNKILFKSFLLNRFSRLYPLHFATLLIVLILQILYSQHTHTYFVYPNNGVRDFFENLLFIQSWGLNKFSFNGPTWIVYLVFFLLAASGLLNTLKSLLITCLAFTVLKKWELVFINDDILTCFYFFFYGCLFIKIYEKLLVNSMRKIFTILFLALSLLLIGQLPGFLVPIYQKVAGYLDIEILISTVVIIMLFLTIFNSDIFRKVPNRFFQFFGDMTYSTYLIHFPLQLAIYILIRPENYQLFLSKNFFIAYLLTVILLGRLIYCYFELPLQNIIRTTLIQPKRIGNI
jgi:peptidoglycan/LPS O-acetylase OafA/YrhL